MADDHKDRLTELAELVLGAYALVAELLADLPIPVVLPDFASDSEVTFEEALTAAQRARTLLESEPIPEVYKRAYDGVILDWMTAFDLTALAREAGLAPWRADAIEDALMRVGAAGQVVESGDLDGWGG